VLLGAFFSGVAAALGHHLFYQSLNGHSVGMSFFEQQLNSDLGTGFAFLVRALFVIAIGTAHVQLLWNSFTAGPSTVGTIDSLFVQRSVAHTISARVLFCDNRAARNTQCSALSNARA
jgi:hypothetical protein